MNAEIIKDVGGDLVLDAPELARPSAATVTLYTPAGVEHVASATATIDPANELLTANSDAGSATVTVADSSDFEVGRRYVMRADGGRVEWVRVVNNDTTADVLTLAGELAFSYTTTSSIFSTQLTVAVTAAKAATLDEGYEGRWKYTVGGDVQRVNTYWDVTLTRWMDVAIPRYQFKLIAGDLAAPEFESVEGEGLAFEEELEQAVIKVRREVSSRGYRPALFRSVSDFTEAFCQRLLLSFSERGENVPSIWQDDPTGWIELRREVYEQSIVAALNNANYDADESGDVTDIERDARLGSSVIRL